MNLRRLSAAVTLTFALALTVIADCPPPGEMNSPPCPAAQIKSEDSSVETSDSSTSTTSLQLSITELAIDLAESALLLF